MPDPVSNVVVAGCLGNFFVIFGLNVSCKHLFLKEMWKSSGLQFKGLSPTVHGLFDHLWQYVKYSPVPLGLLSEEPIEV